MNALRSHRFRNQAYALLCLIVLLMPVRSGAATPGTKGVVLKLGTVAPNGSSVHKILLNMGAKWSKVLNGAELRIYPGAIAGGEADMVRKMKIGQLDAAGITANGLADIDPAVQSLQGVPMLFRSLDEVDYITEKLRPQLDQRLREKGFVALFWLDVGWVRFFSKAPVQRPDDLKKTKLFTWAGDTQTFDIYKSAGFHPVALETNDILPMLRTGMITAVPYPPFFALTSQTFTVAPNMLDLDWAPLVGALVVTERSWNKLPPAAQGEMAKIALEAGLEMKAENRRESDAAVEAMKKRGLHVYQPTPEEEKDWRRVAEISYPRIRGGVVPADFFDEVQHLLAAYRAGHPQTGPAPSPKLP
jgi:TRAP-type C4-dicarboxylate transport system substrate-binding protein